MASTGKCEDSYEALVDQFLEVGPATKDYRTARSVDELLELASLWVCIAACHLKDTLRLPKRGVLILKTMKVICPNRYYGFMGIDNEAFVECALFSVRHVIDVMKNDAKIDIPNKVFQRDAVNDTVKGVAPHNVFPKLATLVGAQWYHRTGMPRGDIEIFKRTMTRIIIDYDDNWPTDVGAGLERILVNTLKKNSPDIVNDLAVSAFGMRSPLGQIEAGSFAVYYQKLSKI